MKRILLSFFVLVVSTLLMAVPADRQARFLRLTDGRVVTAYLIGDEHYSWFQTVDGFVVEPVSDGLFELTTRDGEQERLRAQSVWDKVNGLRKAPRKIGSQASAPLPSVGSPKVPVILVNFADSVFTVADTPEAINHYYDLYCNGTRDGHPYTGHNSCGSIRDYFIEQSDSLFQPEFVIIGPVTVEKPEAYYGKNSKSKKDSLYNTFVKHALTEATKIYQGEWSDFDNKNKGHVDMAFLIFAGCGENSCDNPNLLWPKENYFGQTFTLDDGTKITFSTSGCCSEKAMSKNAQGIPYTRPDGIGVMCHELCHALGLPDLYDTNYIAFGMDVWSIMDYGEYMVNGYYPVSMTAYERDFMGWKPLQTLETEQWMTLRPIATDGFGYKIINETNPNEYYIIESRQGEGCDTRLSRYGHGLQVTHIDYDRTLWNNNSVNTDANHQRMTIIAANNMYWGSTALQNKKCTRDQMFATWEGNLFPFEDNDSLTSFSNPKAVVFAGDGLMHKDIHAIREHDDHSMTLFFGSADITDVPLMPEPPAFTTEEGSDDFDYSTIVTLASQQGTEIYYTTDGSEPTTDSYLYTEPIILYETTTVKAKSFVGKYVASEVSEVTVTKHYDAIVAPPFSTLPASELFDASGRRVNDATRLRPGLYIRSGHKYLIQ